MPSGAITGVSDGPSPVPDFALLQETGEMIGPRGLGTRLSYTNTSSPAPIPPEANPVLLSVTWPVWVGSVTSSSAGTSDVKAITLPSSLIAISLAPNVAGSTGLLVPLAR